MDLKVNSPKHDRLTEIRLLLADADFTPKPDDVILSKMGCIYLFVQTNISTEEDELQIAVGWIGKVNENPKRIDIRFCPRKGAKPPRRTFKLSMLMCGSI